MTYKNSQPRSSLDHEDNVEGKSQLMNSTKFVNSGDAHMIINCIIFSMSCILVLLGSGITVLISKRGNS